MDVAGVVWLVVTSVVLSLVLSGGWLMTGNLAARRWARDDRQLECTVEPSNWRRLIHEGRAGSWRRGAPLALVLGAVLSLVGRPGGIMAMVGGVLAFAASTLALGLFWGMMGLRNPPRYSLTRRGLAVSSSALFFPPPYVAGSLVHLSPGTFSWEALGPYWWDRGVLNIRYKRKLPGTGLLRLPLPSDQHRQVQAYIRARGLKHAPEGTPLTNRSPVKSQRRRRGAP
ncbi:MAG: hypothetical protein AB1445_08965 [Bacillota bacterium]